MKRFNLNILLIILSPFLYFQSVWGQKIIALENDKQAILKNDAIAMDILLDLFGDSVVNDIISNISGKGWIGRTFIYYNDLFIVDSVCFSNRFKFERLPDKSSKKSIEKRLRAEKYIFQPYWLYNSGYTVSGKDKKGPVIFMTYPEFLMWGYYDHYPPRLSKLKYLKKRIAEVKKMPVIDIYGNIYY